MSVLGELRHFRRLCGRLRRLVGPREALRFVGATLRRAPIHELPLPDGEGRVAIRPGHSDVDAYWQVFGRGDCDVELHRPPDLVIDGGANVGFASLRFAATWPGARIIAVEPDAANCAMIRRNCVDFQNVEVVEAALWPTRGRMVIENPGDESWSFRVTEVADPADPGSIEAVTIGDLLDRSGAGRIGLLKLDVEGAERPIFEHPDRAWLDRVDALVIEVHDEATRAIVESAMAGLGFRRKAQGEKLVFRRPAG